MSETSTLLALLQRHYIKPGQDLPGGVFLPEVGQNGSWGASSRCDAIYVGFTTSSGRVLVGHELKVSRADWLNELNKPGKADAWADQCHEWWLVVPDPAIVRDGELPAGWGLMYPGRSKTRMQVHTVAARKDPATHRPSWDAARSIIARHDTLRASTIAAARAKARETADAEARANVDRLVEIRLRDQPDTAELQQKLARIEQALGGRIDWTATDTGRGTWGTNITLGQLEAIAAAVHAYGSAENALQALIPAADSRRDPLAPMRQALDRLDTALREFRSVATT